MQRLTGLEFMCHTEEPQLVRVYAKSAPHITMTFFVTGWIAFSIMGGQLLCNTVDDLVIEGDGIGKPFWNDEYMSWVCSFDKTTETNRLTAIRRAMRAESLLDSQGERITSRVM